MDGGAAAINFRSAAGDDLTPGGPRQRVALALLALAAPQTVSTDRLAVEQGDRDLAEKTLHGLLARNPEHEEAARLLAELTAPAADEWSPAEPQDRTEATVRALQGWLSGVRLAAERLAR